MGVVFRENSLFMRAHRVISRKAGGAGDRI